MYISIGRSGSLPSPINVEFIPKAAATGIKNLKVEPLSQQSIFANLFACSIPVTVTVELS